MHSYDTLRQSFKSSIAQATSIPEIKRIFSGTARLFVEEMLEGRMEIAEDAIQLETENGGAIFIQESLAGNGEFQQICRRTPCLSVLKRLAEIALQGGEKEREEGPS